MTTTVINSGNLINDALLNAAKAGFGEIDIIIGNTAQPKDFDFPVSSKTSYEKSS